MAKMKTNQEGGAILAKDSGAAGNQLESNQKSEGAGKIRKANSSRPTKGAAKYGHKGAADFPEKGTQEHKASVKHSGSGEHLGAKRMGYNQSFGAARMGGYAKGAAKVASIMSFGAAKYGHMGAADAGHGGSAGHKHDPVDGNDVVPQYKTVNTTTTHSGGGSSTSNNNNSNSSSGSSSSGRTSFSSDPVERAKQKEWIKNNPVKYKQMLAEKKAKNTSTSTGTNNSSTNSEVKEETIVIGDRTRNDVILSGEEQKKNARAEREAKRLQAILTVKQDSADDSNEMRKLQTRNGSKPLTAVVGNKITRIVNADAREKIEPTVGREEAEKMFPRAAHKRTGPEAGTEGGVFTWEDYL
jgi:hypothetical protein